MQQHASYEKREQLFNYSFQKILTGSDLSTRRLPLMIIKSKNPGPVVWLTACVHGDEVGSIIVVQEIFKLFRKEPLLKGTLYAFPLMNPIGFETMSRMITLSKEDLNRSFPGDKHGSLAERVAEKIFTTITKTKPQLVLDLHNDWIKSIPYTLIDPYPGIKHKDAYEKTKEYSLKTGFFIINEQEEAADREELKRSLTGSLIQNDIPAITLELGGAGSVDESNVEQGVKSIWNILTSMEMTKPLKEPFNYNIPEQFKGKIFKYSHEPVCATTGIIRFLVKPGDIVKKGQAVARIYNVFGKLQETVDALEDGIVLGYADSPVANPGMPVIAFAVI